MKPTNDEGSAVRTQTPQEQTKADPAIVTQQAATCLDKQRHPLSATFGDMPADEFAALVADIKRNGQISDIVKAADGSILDGWHRYRACIEAGITPRIEPFSYIIEAAAETAGRTLTEAEFVVAQNAHRRHLTAEQRRRVVAELLKADPAKSDRAVGSMAKVDHKTVAAVRRQAEAGGEIPHLTKTTGKDGKKYAKPASKAKATPRAPAPLGPRGPGSRNVVIVEGVEVLDPGHATRTAPLAAKLPPVAPSDSRDESAEEDQQPKPDEANAWRVFLIDKCGWQPARLFNEAQKKCDVEGVTLAAWSRGDTEVEIIALARCDAEWPEAVFSVRASVCWPGLTPERIARIEWRLIAAAQATGSFVV